MLGDSTLAPVTRVMIARYAGAVGDFNPIHVDEEFAKSLGLPSVIAHGPLTLALALDEVVDQLGARCVRSFSARLSSPVFPGDQIKLTGREQGFDLVNSQGRAVASVELETGPDDEL